MRYSEVDLTLVCNTCGGNFRYAGNKWGIPLWAECPECREDVPDPTLWDHAVAAIATAVLVASVVLICVWR